VDFRLEQWINGPAGHHPALDSLMVHAASWGEAIFIALVVGWFLIGWVRGFPDDRRGAITALIGAGVGLLINQVIGHAWARPRPFVTHPGQVHVLLGHSVDASFPSDHAVAAFAISVVLVAVHRKAGFLALLFAALLSYARVYVGDHYPGDVLTGACIGTLVALALVTWFQPAMNWVRDCVDRVIRLLHLPLPADRSRSSAPAPARHTPGAAR